MLLAAMMVLAGLSPASAHASAAEPATPVESKGPREGMPEIATSPEPTIFAELGWGTPGGLISERWNPVRVVVQGGTAAMSGSLVAEVRRGGSVYYRAVLPIVVTPQTLVSYDMAVVLPVGYWSDVEQVSVEVSLVSERGRTVQRLVHTDQPEQTELRLPPRWAAGTPLIAVVGETTLNEWLGLRSRIHQDSSLKDTPGSEVMEWNSVGPRQATPTDPWTEFVVARVRATALPTLSAPYHELAALVLFGPAIDKVSDQAHDAITQWVRLGGRLVLIPDGPGRMIDRWLPERIADVTYQGEGEASRLVVEVGPSAAKHEWRSQRIGEPLITLVHGRVGLGWAMVLARDPGKDLLIEEEPADSTRARLAEASWPAALEPVLADYVNNVEEMDAARRMYLQLERHFGWQLQHDMLDALVRTFSGTTGFPFWIFAAFVAGIAMLLGPIDRVVLRRLRLSGLAWLTALMWLLLMGGVAYYLPISIRSGTLQTAEGRTTFVMPSEGIAWQTAGTAYMTASSTALELRSPERAWWRPVLASFETDAPLAGDPLTVDQSRSMQPRPVRVPVWSFRAFMRQGTVTPSDLNGWVEPPVGDKDGWRVVLVGADVPRATSVQLITPDQRGFLEKIARDDQRAEFRGSLMEVELNGIVHSLSDDGRHASLRALTRDAFATTTCPDLTISRLLRTGRWALVIVEMSSEGPPATAYDTRIMLLPVRLFPLARPDEGDAGSAEATR